MYKVLQTNQEKPGWGFMQNICAEVLWLDQENINGWSTQLMCSYMSRRIGVGSERTRQLLHTEKVFLHLQKYYGQTRIRKWFKTHLKVLLYLSSIVVRPRE
jgi:hypothetical protein